MSLYLEYILNLAVLDRFRAFYLGFHSVCASNALIMLRPEEVSNYRVFLNLTILKYWFIAPKIELLEHF